MKQPDIGVIDGPLLVFGGPYSNLHALRALRREAEALGFTPAQCLCTGDVVAYCGDPVATVAEIRDWGVAVVAGNCEEQLAADADDCGCGFEEGTACDALSQQWYAFARGALDAEARAWMAGLPARISFSLAGLRGAAVHATHAANNRFIFPSTPEDEKQESLAALGCDLVLSGHSGIPFTQRLTGGGIWHNAGAIGVPANDATLTTWYAILTPHPDGLKVEHRRLSYDHAGAAARMRAAGLGEGYARALETGLWPSLDVLPARERTQTGRPLVVEPTGQPLIFPSPQPA